METSLEKQLRKTLDNLRITGTALILLGFWDILKYILYISTGLGDIPDFSADSIVTMNERPMDWILIFILIVDIAVRLFIGLRAIREEKAKRRGRLHLVLAGGMFVFLCLAMVYTFTFSKDSQHLDSYLISFLMDITTLWTLSELIRLTHRTRKLQSLQGAG